MDTWLFDLAVCLNDWCIDLATGVQNATRARALIAAYESVRPLVTAERELLPAMLRAGAGGNTPRRAGHAQRRRGADADDLGGPGHRHDGGRARSRRGWGGVPGAAGAAWLRGRC